MFNSAGIITYLKYSLFPGFSVSYFISLLIAVGGGYAVCYYTNKRMRLGISPEFFGKFVFFCVLPSIVLQYLLQLFALPALLGLFGNPAFYSELPLEANAVTSNTFAGIACIILLVAASWLLCSALTARIYVKETRARVWFGLFYAAVTGASFLIPYAVIAALVA